MIGFWQIVIVFFLAFVLFGGAKKFPGAMHELGLGLKNFRKAMKDEDDKKNIE